MIESAADSVLAVVPTYRPSKGDLEAVLERLAAEKIPAIVVDDGSPCTYDPVLRAASAIGATVVRHRGNAGIARSLNAGLRRAAFSGFEWLLTVDQDTTLPPGYVAALLHHADPDTGVIGAEIIGDASGDLRYPVRDVRGRAVTEEVFQTGSLWSVSALTRIDGFDESLGIDGVDSEACLSLREAGFDIVVARGVRLEHRYGSGRQIEIPGRSIVATGHSPARRESMVRNRLALFPRELRQSPLHALRTMRRVGVNALLGMTVEDERWAKAKGAARGLLPRRSK